MNVLALALTLALAADGEGEAPSDKEIKHQKLVPPYVPRGFSLGLFINTPVVSPNVRIDWNIDIYASSTHNFFALAEIGAGLGFSRPAGMSALYQYMGLVGFGYRNVTHVIHWGFQFGIGPLWYRAAFDKTVPYVFDSKVVGYAEGRVQAGFELTPNLVLGVYFGFASPWSVDTSGRYPGSLYLGGFMPGLFLDWN